MSATGLDRLLDAAAATVLLRSAGLTIASARPDYVRHKPGETSLIGYRFVTPDGGEARGYAHWCADTHRADAIHAKASTLRPRTSAVGVGTVRVDAHTVFYGFPNDASLRRLRWYVGGTKLKHSLASLVEPGVRISKLQSTSTVLTYKPERRVVARIDLVTDDGRRPPMVVRYTTDPHAARLAAVATQLRAHGVATPAPVAQLDDGRVSVDEFVTGSPLGTHAGAAPVGAAAIAAGVLGFHSTPAPATVAVRSVDAELRNALDALAALRRMYAGLAPGIEQLSLRLRARRPDGDGRSVLVHGDLHPDNLLIDDGRVVFVDLERAALGNAAADLGRLRAGSLDAGGMPTERSATIDDAIEAYRLVVPVEADRLEWYTALALVDRALLATRRLDPSACESAGRLLDTARSTLDRVAA